MDGITARFHCIVGGSRAARETAASELIRHGRVVDATPARRWPFVREIVPPGGPADAPQSIWIPDLHRAFPTGQTSGTRVVLTQSTYQLQRWLDWLETSPATIVVAHAEREAMERSAPEAFAQRGPWARIDLVLLDGDESREPVAADASVDNLQRAFAEKDPAAREAIFGAAAERTPDNPALHVLLASAQLERQRLEDAQDALERALALAPDWEAVWFEYGKLWLRADDLERASERFAEAARLMPSFAAALSNLGAARAEIGQVDAAVAALQQALLSDPRAHTTLNNLAVIRREQGRLDEAIDAGRRVIALAPDFVFGYYNLGHALFLQGRFAEARDAYADGRERDPQKNAVQACRLAVCRAAAGEHARAIAELTALVHLLPPDESASILGEAEETLAALVEMPQLDRDNLARVLKVVRDARK